MINNNLTPEALSNFSNNLSKAKELDDRRLKIASKLLEMEDELHLKRIGHLKEYYKEFEAITKKGSDLPEIFQVIDGAYYTPNKSSKPSKPNSTHKTDSSKKKTNSSPKNTNNSYNGKNLTLVGFSEDNEKKLEHFKKNALAIFTELSDLERKMDADAKASLYERAELEENIFQQKQAQRESQLQAITEYHDKLAKTVALEQTSNEDALTALATQKKIEQLNIKAQRLSVEQQLGVETNNADLDEQIAINNIDYVAEAEMERYNILSEMKEKREKEIAAEIYKIKLQNNGKISELERLEILQNINEKYKTEEENIENFIKEKYKKEQEEAKKTILNNLEERKKAITSGSLNERIKVIKEIKKEDTDYEGQNRLLSSVVGAISDAIADLAKQLEQKIDKIAQYQGNIDTRLQGSNNEKSSGSYWKQLTKDMMSVGLITPYFQQEKFAENIQSLVDQGIAFDLKQRAFLMTVSDRIATTFNVADGTLLRLIRIQQEDSSAGRLGMESALNTFLNSMYENTEYLQQVASSVRSSLEEMEALLSGAQAAEIEYQVQKWMGSLYSVGMSDNAVSSIAQAIGLIGSGQLEGISGGDGASNLVIMAASNAGLSIADLLTNGLTAENTNTLLEAIVNYLADISKSSADNRVVQQQLANVFGVKASDLRAAANLVTPGTVKNIAGHNLSYDNMLAQLNFMASSMGDRMSIAERMTNIWENGQYSLASSIANTPVSFLIYKLASLLDSAVGGIDLPFVNVMGFGVDLNTTVSDLMRVASLSTGILGNLAPMIQGLSNSFNGQRMLEQMGIRSGSGLAVTPRGKSVTMARMSAGRSMSESGYIGNASSSDIKASTIQESKNMKKQEMIEAQEENKHTELDTLNETTLKIYELMHDISQGKNTFKVKVVDYGLTTNGDNYVSSANGGADGVARLAARAASIGGGYSGDLSTHTTGDLGGWVMTSI